jgi:acyl-coenzyme A thioesterase PaaI-like protein
MSGAPTAPLVVLPVGPEAAFGVGAVSLGPDGVHGTMPTGRPYLGPDGRPSVGALGVLVDDVTGYAVIHGLIDGAWSVSTEIWLDLLGPLPDSGTLSASARVVHATTVSGFTEGWVADDSGVRIAQCRQRGRAIPETPFDLEPSSYHVRTGATDVAELIGLQPVDGRTTLLSITPDLENPRHMLHGGVSLCASEVTAVLSRMAAGVDLPTSSVHIAHTRGIPAGSEVLFRAETRHAGRTFWITEVTGWVNGKVACVSTVSAQKL